MSYPQFDYETSLRNRALALVPDVSPFFNLTPVIELLREADRMGFEVVQKRQSPNPKAEALT